MKHDPPVQDLSIGEKVETTHVDTNVDRMTESETSETITWTPEEEKKLVRKIDLFLMPTIWFMYLLSYMDRTK
jgi:hypothetical protein